MNISYFKGRKSPWCFDVRVKGKRIRKFFKTEAKAKLYAREFSKQKEKYGLEAMSFPPEERADYKLCLEEAKKRGFTTVFKLITALFNAKDAQNTAYNAISQGKTVKDAFREFLDEKSAQKRADRTIKDLRSRCGRFADAFLHFSDITQAKVEQWCISQNTSPRTARNNFVAVRTFLAWARRRGYHSMPLDFDRSSFLPRELKKQKAVFSLSQCKQLLDLLQQNTTYRRLIPFFALQLFCGIRRAEVERMTWDLIDFEKKSIRLPAEITKTGDEHIMRPPFLPPTVFAWLAPFAPTVNKTAKIQKPSEWTRANIAKELPFQWENNGMRHTFATMHVSLHGDPAKTAVLLRHRNQQRLWQNYLARLIPEEDAKAYFDMRPNT